MEETSMNLRDLRNALGRRVEAAHFLQEITVVTTKGEPRAVLIPHALYRPFADWYTQHKST
jgi:hypothetical protein